MVHTHTHTTFFKRKKKKIAASDSFTKLLRRNSLLKTSLGVDNVKLRKYKGRPSLITFLRK